jgi:glycosyltransferase involved in cell wall biosynthesis
LTGGFDLSGYDLIVSSSSACAKWVRNPKKAMHVCYCHTPMRYIWDLFDDYFGPSAFGPVRWFAKLFRPYLQWCDLKSNKGVTHFLANSTEVQNRIKRIYNRESEVIHPPVDVNKFKVKTGKGDYFLIISALVPYKKIDLAVKVCTKNNWPLVVAGKGSEEKKLKAIAGPTITFDGWVSDEKLSASITTKPKLCFFPAKKTSALCRWKPWRPDAPSSLSARGVFWTACRTGKPACFSLNKPSGRWKTRSGSFETMTFDPNELRQRAAHFSKERFLFRTQIYFRRLFGIPTIPDNDKF